MGIAVFLFARGSYGEPPDGPKAEPGFFKVQSIEKVVLQDVRRQKELQLRINHPEGPGPFPVIVFSHGAGGSKDNYRALTEFWAGHGYVTIAPSHSDSRSLGGRPGAASEFQDWASRPADVSFILDSLAEIERKLPELRGQIDQQRIGVGGHSFGANTAQLIGGAKAFPRKRGEGVSFEDRRVSAVLIMSGQGPGEMLTESSWRDFQRPMLVMTGSKDGPTRTGEPAEWRRKPYELSPPGDKYLVWVEGLDHGYGGITGAPFSGRHPLNPDHVAYTKIATLAFWDAYLKGSASALASLRSRQLTALSNGMVKVEYK